MGWRNFLAVIFLSGCMPNVPIDYWISASCTPEEAQAIKKAALSWNTASCVDVFLFHEIFEDKVFEMDDIQDEKPVVYCVSDEENPVVNNILRGDKYQGYTSGDIILRRKVAGMDVDLEMYRGLAAHEFGHKLRFGHTNYPGVASVMRLDPKDISLRPLSPTMVDIYGNEMVEGLCGKIDCPAECPTRPTL